jgi:hypothetical protein
MIDTAGELTRANPVVPEPAVGTFRRHDLVALRRRRRDFTHANGPPFEEHLHGYLDARWIVAGQPTLFGAGTRLRRNVAWSPTRRHTWPGWTAEALGAPSRCLTARRRRESPAFVAGCVMASCAAHQSSLATWHDRPAPHGLLGPNGAGKTILLQLFRRVRSADSRWPSRFVGRPGLALLDEPTEGLDVEVRHALSQAVRHYHDGGGTVVLTSDYLEEVEPYRTGRGRPPGPGRAACQAPPLPTAHWRGDGSGPRGQWTGR